MFTLVVEFGGLCMFVPRFAGGNTKLSVLLPNYHHHVARVIYKTGGGCKDEPIVIPVIDWTGSSMSNAPSVKMPPEILPLSDGLGKPVQRELLESAAPANCIRLDLTFPEEFYAVGQRAPIDVAPWNAGIDNPYKAVGRVRAKWTVNDDKLDVGGHRFKPGDNGWLELKIFNSPMGASERKHNKGDPLTHQEGYLQLLEAPGTVKFKVGEDGEAYEIGDCGEVRDMGDLGPRSIDPFLCTVSRGCDPADPDCTSKSKHSTHEGQQVEVEGFASTASKAVSDALARLRDVGGPDKADTPRLFFPKGIGEITASVTANAGGASPNFSFSLAIRESAKP